MYVNRHSNISTNIQTDVSIRLLYKHIDVCVYIYICIYRHVYKTVCMSIYIYIHTHIIHTQTWGECRRGGGGGKSVCSTRSTRASRSDRSTRSNRGTRPVCYLLIPFVYSGAIGFNSSPPSLVHSHCSGVGNESMFQWLYSLHSPCALPVPLVPVAWLGREWREWHELRGRL